MMNFTEYYFYRELVARIKCLPGQLSPVENEILIAVSQAIKNHDKKRSLKKSVKAILEGRQAHVEGI